MDIGLVWNDIYIDMSQYTFVLVTFGSNKLAVSVQPDSNSYNKQIYPMYYKPLHGK